MRIVAQAAGLPGATQGQSTTAEAYFDQFDGTDAIVKIPIAHILRTVSGTSVSRTLGAPRKFLVRAGGIVVGSTAGGCAILLDAGSSTSAGSNTTIASTGNLALDTDDSDTTFSIEAELLLGPTDSKLQGEFKGWVNNTVVARTVLTESVTDLIATGVLSFKVAFDFENSDANNFAQLTFLEVLV